MALPLIIAATIFALVWLRRALSLIPFMKERYVVSNLVDGGMSLICALPLAGAFIAMRTNDANPALVLTILGIVGGAALLAVGLEREFRSVKSS
jgi:hypothetical protein